jgi:hypothetical protein
VLGNYVEAFLEFPLKQIACIKFHENFTVKTEWDLPDLRMTYGSKFTG